MKPDESSIEFDMFEDVRRALTRILREEGRDEVEAERIAFYVVQGIREVPKLLTALARTSTPAAKIHEILGAVLDNASALEKARALLLGLDDKIVH
jgi:hypothetical protein